MMKNYQLTPTKVAICPICNSKSAKILWSVDSSQAAQHYVTKEADTQRFLNLAAHIKELWKQNTCDIVQCDDCGFCYSNPYIAGDDKFYTLAYERSHYPTWKWEHQLTYEALLHEDSKNFKLLEIGAGDGAFVKGIAPNLTSLENVVCTEFSDYGKEQIQNYGIKCLSEDIREVKAEVFKEYFDVVCMYQVIEHMDRLDTLFESLNWLTKPHAKLFVSVPNPKHVEFSELNGGLMDMPPNHIGRWNKECFERIGKHWDWQVDRFEIEKTDFISGAILFYKYIFWRKCQESGTLANKISQIKNPHLSKLMRLVGIGFYTLKNLSTMKALSSEELGLSQWVLMKKIN
ncbi:MAG: class I SAM-dependent methyltransferase [Hydrococcus sp. Prado102]|jgi:2-polyprenyl-3-methyl-5-hydroxy-6-metoxy-1,4-benzoquinol methylase|nr:class I SAM-dependent methyltransferase [Hydrococcus sp. Prado102]